MNADRIYCIYSRLWVVCLLPTFLFVCAAGSAQAADVVVPVTIWIHGTNMQTLLPVQSATYGRWYGSPAGIHAVANRPPDCNAHLLCSALSRADSKRFSLAHCYTFGWSGILDADERSKASQWLAADLVALYQNYHARGQGIELSIICHSHGGNVALELPRYVGSELVSIKRLILLACPVQAQTADYTRDPLFEAIYSFYSWGDLIQVGDPQGLHPWRTAIRQAIAHGSFAPLKRAWELAHQRPFFSGRFFAPQPNLVNICVSWEKTVPWTPEDIASQSEEARQVLQHGTVPFRRPHPVLHSEFILPSFVRALAHLVPELEQQDVLGQHAHLNFTL